MKIEVMNEEINNEISNLKENIKIIITLFEELKAKYNHLNEEKIELLGNVELKNKEIEDLKQKYETLKLAKTIAASSTDSHEAKLKVNRIVREIDKCIALLNK